MEAFYSDDQEIREWVDLFIEKLFTVNLLSGNDADGEFYQGRQAVEKIASSFQEILDLPNEVLIDGIRQLVEQRLPDHRVIDNFPDFYVLMNDMILAGLQSMRENEKDRFPQQISNLKGLQHIEGSSIMPSSRVALNGSGTLTKDKEMDSSFSLRHHLLKAFDSPLAIDSSAEISIVETAHSPVSATSNSHIGVTDVSCISDNIIVEDTLVEDTVVTDIAIEDSYNLEFVEEYSSAKDDESIPALSMSVTLQKEEDSHEDISFPPARDRDPFRFNAQKKKNNDVLAEIPVKPVVMIQEIPQNGMMLSRVLKQLYGDLPIQWNITVQNLVFFAKAGELLIYIEPSYSSEVTETEANKIIKKIKKDNFRVYICKHEDLAYPRRLERGIRRVKR
ncbi:hypothetical protein AAC978_12400 [Desulfitobacterium sp. THU1]|uniref:hypothetical protein n=1 Tax=Desulfitobacterium sp. THU1 TaxID=3138072 RepID=UPI00311F8254